MNVRTEQDVAISHDAAHLDMQVLDAIDQMVLSRNMSRAAAMRHQREVMARALEMLDGRIQHAQIKGGGHV